MMLPSNLQGGKKEAVRTQKSQCREKQFEREGEAISVDIFLFLLHFRHAKDLKIDSCTEAKMHY
jgi:hypothetical protein